MFSKFDTANYAGQTLTFPLAPTGAYDFQVDWGDGSSSYCNTPTCSHQYSQPSFYNVSVSGLLKGFSFITTYGTMANKLVDVLHWGGVCLGDGGQQFREVTLTRWTASDLPCTSQFLASSPSLPCHRVTVNVLIEIFCKHIMEYGFLILLVM
eukprot:g67396.t1